MSEEVFIKVITSSPGNDMVRLVYADWLEDQGDVRGDLLRLEIQLLGLTPKDEGYAALQEQFAALVARVDPVWWRQMARPEPRPVDPGQYAEFYASQKSYTSDDTTFASDPGMLTLSMKKLAKLRPDLAKGAGGWLAKIRRRLDPRKSWLVYIAEHIKYGDSRAAVVLSSDPLLIAAYTDELDCVAVLKFPPGPANEYQLEPGARLVTVNRYQWKPRQEDLDFGPNQLHRYLGFTPMIAEFLTDDMKRLAVRRDEITPHEWARTYTLGMAYRKKYPGRHRDGRPGYTHVAAR